MPPVLPSFTELAIYSAPARDRAERLNQPTAWICKLYTREFPDHTWSVVCTRDETNMSKPIETWWHDMILVMYEHWWYIEIHVQFSYIHVRYVTLKYIKYNRSMFTYVRMYDSSVLYHDCPTVFVPCFSTTSLCKWEFADGHIPRLAVIHRQRLDVHKNAPMLNIKPWNRQKNLPQRSVACILS